METLIIEETKATPYIKFDIETNIMEIRGQSYPENAFKFYEPILKWLGEYLMQAEGRISIEIDFSLPYINSSSSKCIIMLLDKLQESYDGGKNIIINWHYDEDNESSLECAEEFKEDLTLPFNIIKS